MLANENNKIETDSFLQPQKDIVPSNDYCSLKWFLLTICLVVIGGIIGGLIVYFTKLNCTGVPVNSRIQKCFVDDYCKAYLELLASSNITVSFR